MGSIHKRILECISGLNPFTGQFNAECSNELTLDKQNAFKDIIEVNQYKETMSLLIQNRGIPYEGENDIQENEGIQKRDSNHAPCCKQK